MKRVSIAALGLLAILMLAGPSTHAKVGLQDDDTNPCPEIKRDVVGVKGAGVAHLRLSDFDTAGGITSAMAEVTFRLRFKKQIAIFYGEFPVVNVDDCALVGALRDHFAQDALETFFPGEEGLEVAITAVEEDEEFDEFLPTGPVYKLADISVRVRSAQ